MVAINNARSGHFSATKNGTLLTLFAFFVVVIFSSSIVSTAVVNKSPEMVTKSSTPTQGSPASPIHHIQQESDFTLFKGIEAEMANFKYVSKFECELCISDGDFHSLLYALGRHTSGPPVLEERSFCGCSTAVLAIGMKDAAKVEK
jgi:hypothetical protein